jgi:chemotaxis signal transduction protein
VLSETTVEPSLSPLFAHESSITPTVIEIAPNPAPIRPIQHLVFLLGNHPFALPVDLIVEIAPREPIDSQTPAPDWHMGQTTVRGTCMPVIDLQFFLGITGPADASARHFVVVRRSRNESPRALLVREVHVLHPVAAADLVWPPSLQSLHASPFLRGLVEFRRRNLFVLNAGVLFDALAELQ